MTVHHEHTARKMSTAHPGKEVILIETAAHDDATIAIAQERPGTRLTLFGRRVAGTLGLCCVVSVATALACLIAELIAAWLFHLSSPYTWPLTPYDEFALDLNQFTLNFDHWREPGFFALGTNHAFAYPAPMALLYCLIYVLPFNLRRALFVPLLVALVLCALTAFGRALTRHGLGKRSALAFCILVFVTSYPLAFEAKQANFEIFVVLLTSLGIWFFLRGRNYSASACFGLAASMKLFPVIYFGLFLARRKYRPIVFGLLVAATTMALSLQALNPDPVFAWQQIRAGIAQFQSAIILKVSYRDVGFDHSLFALVKLASLHLAPGSDLKPVLTSYMVTCALAGTALFFARIQKLPVANQLLALTVSSILLPPVSYDYTLLHLYAPLAVLLLLAIDAAQTELPVPRLSILIGCIALTLGPWSEVIFHGMRLGGELRSLLLFVLLCLSVTLRTPGPIKAKQAKPLKGKPNQALSHQERNKSLPRAFLDTLKLKLCHPAMHRLRLIEHESECVVERRTVLASGFCAAL